MNDEDDHSPLRLHNPLNSTVTSPKFNTNSMAAPDPIALQNGAVSAQQSPTNALENMLKSSSAVNQMFNQAYNKQALMNGKKIKKITGGKNVFNSRRGQSVMEMASNKLPSLHQTTAAANLGGPGGKLKNATFMHRRNTSNLQ